MAANPCHFCNYNLNGIPLSSGERQCPECGRFSPPGPRPQFKWDPRPWRVPIVVGGMFSVALWWIIVLTRFDPIATGFYAVLGSAVVGLASAVITAIVWLVGVAPPRPGTKAGAFERVWWIIFCSMISAIATVVLCGAVSGLLMFIRAR